MGGGAGRKVYSDALPNTFSRPAYIYSNSGSMIYCKLKNKTKTSHRLVASSPDHYNTEKSNSVAQLDPVSFRSTHCYRQSFREILGTTRAQQISSLEARRRLGKQTQRHHGVQSAEWRCNLSSKASRLFLPGLLSAVRDVPLADGGGSWSPVLGPRGCCPCASRACCSRRAIGAPWWVWCRC